MTAHAITTRASAWLARASTLLLLAWASVGAQAAPVRMVAIGASNTHGWYVGNAGAYPAQLQALLRAQAEIRRREVMRQQANAGAGGSGRQGQDLSALFDKELQRQQRTNYESRSQVEERPDQKNQSDALDRIRDLARRQEELSRKQREAAGSDASEEERKRQLERLMREQAELRDQAEKLARQMEQQGGQQAGQRQP